MNKTLKALVEAAAACKALPLLSGPAAPAGGTGGAAAGGGFTAQELAEYALIEQVAEGLRAHLLARVDAAAARSGGYAEKPSQGRFGGVFAHEKLAAQLATVPGVSPKAAARQLALAGGVFHRLPGVGAALREGWVSVATAQMLTAETKHLSVEAARDVALVVLESNQGHTTAELQAKARRVIVARSHRDPEVGAACAQKAEQARLARRGVTVINHLDGFATLSATLTTAQAAKAESAIAEAAYALRQYDFTNGIEPRAENTARADAFCVLLQIPTDKHASAAIKNSGRKILPPRPVELTITTSWEAMQAVSRSHHQDPTGVLGESSAPQEREMLAPGFISGIGEVNAHDAAEAVLQLWGSRPVRVRFLIHDAVGNVVGLSAATTRYQPDRLLGEAVRARDLTCRWAGCQNPATHADLDHVIPFPAGPTHEGNLVAFCRSHHRMKTHGEWGVKLDPANAHLTLTDPTGRQVITQPHRYLEPGPLRENGPPLKETGPPLKETG